MNDSPLLCPVKLFNLLNVFTSCFTKPQFKNFCHFTNSVILSQYSSIKRFAALGGMHQSSLNDFVTQSPWNEFNVRSKLSRFTAKQFPDACIGIIDDTMSHKPYAKKMSFVDYFYDGLTKTRQKGISIVTHGIHSPAYGFVPFDEQVYKKGALSKNEIACEMISRTQKYKKMSLYIVDSWYSGNYLLKTIKKYKAHYITEVKSNRNVTISQRKNAVRAQEKLLRKSDYTDVNIKGNKYRYAQTEARIKGLGNVNLVFSQKSEGKNWGDTYYLITDIRSMTGERVIELFLKRGEIESFHREAKQQLGLEDFQLRKSQGIERNMFLILLVFVLLVVLQKQHYKKTLEHKTIGEIKTMLKAECYTKLFQHKKPPDIIQKISYGL